MPLPQEYQRLNDHFYLFLTELKEHVGFGSSHQTYTMVQGVFQVYRRRLEIADAIRFANTLPAGLRALFVADWDPLEERSAFDTLARMNQEVRQLRPEHNFSKPTAIQDVALILRRHLDEQAFDALLQSFPAQAREFWRGA